MAAVKKVLVAVAVAAFAAFIGHRFLKLKEMSLASRELTVKSLNCHYIKNIECGAEDITITKDGLAFLSTGLKYPFMPSFCDGPGKMYVLDLLHPKPTPVALHITGKLDLASFNPHGISVYETDDSVYLFVVNHPHHNSQVEIFHFVEEDTLVHLKTVIHPLLHSVNDIVAVGAQSFYATNDHSFPSEALHALGLLLGLAWCDVVFYSPEEVAVAASGFLSSNGINASPDKRYIYVSDIMDHDIDVFERHEGQQLKYIKSVGVGSLCDNIEVDHVTGDVWLGCHPNGMKLLKYDPEDPPGSEVIRIQNIQSDAPALSREYADDGRVIMASTVAAPFRGRLLIGSVFHRALSCTY
ncbi:serum paraoxonase/arylesterase 2-like isoform X2 [Betta splendens]|uniref:Paraoxonase n=1 Tax=Betta splendens TaxID=158456 RepID=A0A6P7KMQ7_BETSP|nr:serum paraoxonase/arylesterase 2-like isoform X2 [Betta splendens]